MKLLINEEGEKLYPDVLEEDLNTNHGIIRKEDFNSDNERIKTHTGVEFLKVEPTFTDLFHSLKRAPQIIRLKDAGFITSELGVKKGDTVLDCGGGSGAMTVFLANTVGDEGGVVSVEKEARFAELIRENLKMFKLENVEVVNERLEDYEPKQLFDAVNIDLPNPWQSISFCEEYLKNAGMLSVYAPNTTQVNEMQKRCEESCLELQGVSELLQRDWKVKNNISHPRFRMLGHTGFVMLFRKIKV